MVSQPLCGWGIWLFTISAVVLPNKSQANAEHNLNFKHQHPFARRISPYLLVLFSTPPPYSAPNSHTYTHTSTHAMFAAVNPQSPTQCVYPPTPVLQLLLAKSHIIYIGIEKAGAQGCKRAGVGAQSGCWISVTYCFKCTSRTQPHRIPVYYIAASYSPKHNFVWAKWTLPRFFNVQTESIL